MFWSFSYAGPSVWNSLPPLLSSSSFKTTLKTHLFNKYFQTGFFPQLCLPLAHLWLCMCRCVCVCVCVCACVHVGVCVCVCVRAFGCVWTMWYFLMSVGVTVFVGVWVLFGLWCRGSVECRAGIYLTTVHLINLKSYVLLRFTLVFGWLFFILVYFYLYVACQIIPPFLFFSFYCGKSFWIALFYTYCVRQVKHRDRLCPYCTQALVSKGLPTTHTRTILVTASYGHYSQSAARIRPDCIYIYIYMPDLTSCIQFSSVLQKKARIILCTKKTDLDLIWMA